MTDRRALLQSLALAALVLAALIAVTWALGRLAVATLSGADLDAVTSAATVRSDLTLSLARGFTYLGATPTLTILTILAGAALLFRRLPLAALAVVLASLGGWAIEQAGKSLVQRPRPPVALHVVTESSYSFPSGHATASAAFYLALALVAASLGASPRLRRALVVAALLLAACIAWSRVWLGVHYPSDVAAGLLLGGTWAVLLSRLLRSPAGR